MSGGSGQDIVHVPEQQAPLVRAPAAELSVEEIVSRVAKVREVHQRIMKNKTHYGIIPGVKKPSLWKPGAELLGMVFRLAPQFKITEQIREEESGHLTVTVTCKLTHIPTGVDVGEGMGSCSTRESKYAYRSGERICPQCDTPAIRKSKTEWYCWKKIDGCGATFGLDDPAITDQQTGRVENPDVADQQNTVLKMAQKRAHIAAILLTTCASEIFTEKEPEGDDAPSSERGPRQQTKNGNGGGYGGSGKPAVNAKLAELLRQHEACNDEESLRKLREPSEAIWKSLSKSERQQLELAFRAAQQRILDTMDRPDTGADDGAKY